MDSTRKGGAAAPPFFVALRELHKGRQALVAAID
jgi:hypothetical protein